MVENSTYTWKRWHVHQPPSTMFRIERPSTSSPPTYRPPAIWWHWLLSRVANLKQCFDSKVETNMESCYIVIQIHIKGSLISDERSEIRRQVGLDRSVANRYHRLYIHLISRQIKVYQSMRFDIHINNKSRYHKTTPRWLWFCETIPR
jgi:hypothetical protein